VAQRFAGEASGGDKVPGIIEVRGLTGSGVTPIGRYSNEAELLFQRSTPYEVLAKYTDDKGVWRITLRELPR
jgi:hypothetical protein